MKNIDLVCDRLREQFNLDPSIYDNDDVVKIFNGSFRLSQAKLSVNWNEFKRALKDAIAKGQR